MFLVVEGRATTIISPQKMRKRGAPWSFQPFLVGDGMIDDGLMDFYADSRLSISNTGGKIG